MARTKKTEKAEPKQAEIISLASLRAKRDAKHADLLLTTYVVMGEGSVAGDVVLCSLTDGGFTFATVEARGENGDYRICRSDRADEIIGVCGRVVRVEVID